MKEKVGRIFGVMICVAIVAVAFSTTVPLEVRAATLYVGPGQTYTTIQSAIDASNAGDTIRVHDGTYDERITVNKTLTLTGNGSATTIITNSGSGSVVTIAANWVNFSGFTVKSGRISGEDAGIKIDSSNDVEVQNCNCSDNPRGIYLVQSSNNRIENNTCSNNAVGILLLSSSSNRMVNNTANSNAGAGIWLDNSSRGEISNNVVNSNWNGIHFRPGYNCNNITMYNNTANSNTNNGMEIIGNYNTITYNIANNNGNIGIIVGGMYNTISYNLAMSNGNGIYISSWNSTITHNVAVNNNGGIVLMNLGYSNFDWNAACCNALGDLSFWIHGSEGATGDSNTCDSSGGWNDMFKTGCSFGCSLSGRVTDGHGHVLEGVRVTLHNLGQYTTYTDALGCFNYCPIGAADVTPPEPYLEVALQDQGTGGTPYMAIYETSPGAVVAAETQTLASITGTVNIDFSNNPGIRSTNIANANDLDDYAVIYLHTYQAVQFSLNTLGLNLDHALPVETYGNTPAGMGTWYTPVPWSGYPSSSISIGVGNSMFNSGNRPDNREWHEFGHHIMADSLIGNDNALPPRGGGLPHAGYANPNSADSWMEGFAEFMSSEIDAAGYPAIPMMSFPFLASVPIQGTLPPYPPNWYGGWGNPRWWDLEWQTNIRGPTRLDEEFAIASILWDLEDPINGLENDFVDLTIGQIWGIINTNNLFPEAGRPPGNPPMTDLRDVYNAFSASALVSQANLDQIFRAHGACDDANGNFLCDVGEQVGYTGDPARPLRRNTTYLDNSFILVTVIDNETMMEIDVDGFFVHDVFDPPHEYLDADFAVSYFNETNKSIYFSMAPYPQHNSTAYISPFKAGHCGVTPLVINNSYYWDRMNTSSYIANHTFYLDRCRPGDDMYIDTNTMLWPDIYNIDDPGQDGVLIINASDIVLDCNGATLDGMGMGIGIYNPGFDNVTIRNCIVANYKHGILVEDASDNVIINNTLGSSWAGVSAYGGGHHIMTENHATLNTYGIDIASDDNIIENNTADSNQNGIWLEFASGNTIVGNIVDANTQVGVSLHDSSSYGTVAENHIEGNAVTGILAWDSSHNNTIYHNSIIDNLEQANDTGADNQWHNGYPSGGNYWDDYVGVDEKVGPGQDKPGVDGIGDTAYIIDADSQDEYPLMSVAPPPLLPPSAPQDLGAVADDQQVTLTWNPPAFDGRSPITNYGVYRGTAPGEEIFLVDVGDVLTYVDTELTAGQTYYYKVSAMNAVGEGAQSNEASATTAPPANQPPTCSITDPVQGATVSGTYTITGTAFDADGTVASVEVRIDTGAWTQVTGTTTWTYDWDTSTASDGDHTIYARSYDGTNYSDEASVLVTVDNAAPPESIFENVWFWIAVLAVIIIVIIIAVIATSRGRKELIEEEPEAPPEPPEEPPEPPPIE
ncbi:MAG: right-handed parallel beta-helix repeat-containing protein [Thermoplasmata archaeon]|nr:right-handed parallel beta-helix repeat-containing protein [Thermoplasmata archaeon]